MTTTREEDEAEVESRVLLLLLLGNLAAGESGGWDGRDRHVPHLARMLRVAAEADQECGRREEDAVSSSSSSSSSSSLPGLRDFQLAVATGIAKVASELGTLAAEHPAWEGALLGAGVGSADLWRTVSELRDPEALSARSIAGAGKLLRHLSALLMEAGADVGWCLLCAYGAGEGMSQNGKQLLSVQAGIGRVQGRVMDLILSSPAPSKNEKPERPCSPGGAGKDG